MELSFDADNFREEAARLRQDLRDLKAENEALAKTVKEERVKNVKHRKKYKQFVVDSKLSQHILEKNLSALRSFISRNYKQGVNGKGDGASVGEDLNSEFLDAAEDLSQRKPLKIDLEFKKIFSVKSLEEDKLSVVDILALRENFVLVYLKETSRVHVKLYFVNDPTNTEDQTFLRQSYIRVALVDAGKSFITTDGKEFKIWPIEYFKPSKDTFQVSAASTISAMTSLNPTTLAVACDSRIFIVNTAGQVYKSLERHPGIFNYFTRVWYAPVLDMCATREDSLIFCDQTGIHRLNPLSGTFTLLSELKTIVSLAAYTGGYFFALDSSRSRILLFGSEGKRPLRVWTVGSQLRSEDQMISVSVCENRCVCVTKFGYVLAFAVNAEEMKD